MEEKIVLELKNVSQAYNEHPVVENLCFRLRRGQIGCLLGSSGSGKTTILRTIAGFEDVIEGEILINSTVVSKKGWTFQPERRSIGMVFQDYALFPHLTVFDNVAFGVRNLKRSEIISQVTDILETVGLSDVHDKYSHELSGGQQQRVALARALVFSPEFLLMDEPFSNLDITLRERLSMEVRDILKGSGITTLIVTHNQQEAFAIADEIGVIHEGKMQQWDTAHNLYHRPANRYVAEFIGEGVLLSGTVINERIVETGLGVLEGEFTYKCATNGCPVDVLIRPEDVVHDDESPFKAEVVRRIFRGANILYMLCLSTGDKVLALVPSHCVHSIGEKIGIRPTVRDIVLFERVE